MLDLYLIRHAQSIRNKTPEIIGGRSQQCPLTPLGELQAQCLGKRLAAEGMVFDCVYSSPAERAKRTAIIACKDIGFSLDAIVLSEDILELDQGDWEGKVRAEMHTPQNIELMGTDYLGFRPPNGESQRDVEARMLGFVKRYIEPQARTPGKRIGVFSHGLAIRCLLRGMMDFSPSLTYRMQTENTSITQLHYDLRGWTPIRINDAAHLALLK
ncbi:histidine phosphatase family protein [Candidatus Woesearchaeota archaeon]|nr:histidine phosphatase family protein [Candidatus Woesearchaeota archaeon]